MWLFNGSEVSTHEDLLPGCTDFVYLITYTDGRMYIGKKTVRSFRLKPPLKGKKRKRRIFTNIPFAKYEGSHDKELGLVIQEKEIIYQCSTKKAAAYLEVDLLFHNEAIFNPLYLNKNISGKFFDNDLDGLIKSE